jgi:hypothetical protein
MDAHVTGAALQPAAQGPRTLVEKHWDPITRIVGSLGIFTKIDFENRQVAECYSTSSIFRGYHAGIIEAIEIDFDSRVHVAVTVDADPGQDLGRQRLPGHRFFFAPDEIEYLGAAEVR